VTSGGSTQSDDRADCAVCDADAAFLRSERPPYEALRPRVRVVDLFAGCGGLTLGVAEAARRLGLGIDVRLAVDNDADATAVYKENMPGADVRRLGVEELFDGVAGAPLTAVERTVKKQTGKVDVLVGGPPCQGHSDLNNHTRRDDPRNALYARMARAAEVLRPAIVLIENVPTVTHDVGKVVNATVRALKANEYSVSETVTDISRLGTPQRRRRHVVLAFRTASINADDIFNELEQRCLRHPARTVRWAIEDLKATRSNGLFDSASVANADNAQRIAWLFAHRKHDLPNSLRPLCHHSDHSYNAMYGRLRWDEPAQTVTTGFGSMGQGRYVHPSRRRTITPHEAARLQMLPDFWQFTAVTSRGSVARLIGNAVPPVLAAALIEPALRHLGLGAMVSVLPAKARKRSGNGSARTTVGSRGSDGQRRTGVPAPSSAAARSRMKAARQRDTGPELALRSELHRLGLRYVVDSRVDDTRRRADIVFRGPGVVVYVDGCFWHGCPQHATIPRENRRWWIAKLKANRMRDLDTDDQLRKAGWTILRFWEHEKPSVAAAQVLVAVVGKQVRVVADRKPPKDRGSASRSRRVVKVIAV
jgi:DNA (cytosine-5)-methyltransferase 1